MLWQRLLEPPDHSKPPAAADPGEEALHDPSTWVDHEADLFGRLADDLDGDEGGTRRPVAGIARVVEGVRIRPRPQVGAAE